MCLRISLTLLEPKIAQFGNFPFRDRVNLAQFSSLVFAKIWGSKLPDFTKYLTVLALSKLKERAFLMGEGQPAHSPVKKKRMFEALIFFRIAISIRIQKGSQAGFNLLVHYSLMSETFDGKTE